MTNLNNKIYYFLIISPIFVASLKFIFIFLSSYSKSNLNTGITSTKSNGIEFSISLEEWILSGVYRPIEMDGF